MADFDDGIHVDTGDPDFAEIASARTTLWMVVVRVVMLATMVLLLRIALGVGYRITVAVLIVAAAWLLGRVD